MFDVRRGEYLRTLFMSLYLLFVLFAYYILKPVSQSLFLNNFDIEKLPYLYILVAASGGVLAYSYTKLAVRTSLRTAVATSTALVLVCLLGFWFLVQPERPWAYYLFNVWVSLFSIVMVSQGWLVAANVFDSREAKRIYGLLGMGSVLGAAFGGSFTALLVDNIGTNNLMFASGGMVLLAYASFRLTLMQKGVSLDRARAAETSETGEPFHFSDLVSAFVRYRHLQVIIAIIALTYMVDVMVEYQFSAMAKQTFSGDHLTAFLGSFRGLYVNLITFVLQLFLTAYVVSRFGVGGTLQVMPTVIGLCSMAMFAFPGLAAAAVARLGEAASRYSFNRTGMELLYLPLPAELKNRTKAFVDIFMDRMARGFGGVMLILLTGVLQLPLRYLSLVVLMLSAVWIYLAARAKEEYIVTVRKRLELRRLDLESARITVAEPATLALVEQTAASSIPRQAVYALSLLAEAPGYNLNPQLLKSVSNPAPEVRGKVFELARTAAFSELLEPALAEVRAAGPGSSSPSIRPATAYALTFSPDARDLARQLLDHPNFLVAEGAIETIAATAALSSEIVTSEWIREVSRSSNPERRRLAAVAIQLRTTEPPEILRALIDDPDDAVARTAGLTAGKLRRREHLDPLIRKLADPHVRGVAIDAIAMYGLRILGTLSDILADPNTPFPIRRQIPRILKRIPNQEVVDVLVRFINLPDLTIRASVLSALNRLRESAPKLSYGGKPVSSQILFEARYYFEMEAALAPFRGRSEPPAARLLAATLEERLRRTIERLFRLLGLEYPPKEIYAAWLAVRRGRSGEYDDAIEFLDNTLDREYKRFIIPLLDSPATVVEQGEELFGVERKTAESALREILRSGDEWLVACAIATAGDLKMKGLRSEIQTLCSQSGEAVCTVARTALLGLS